jgi:hypothetical protein
MYRRCSQLSDLYIQTDCITAAHIMYLLSTAINVKVMEKRVGTKVFCLTLEYQDHLYVWIRIMWPSRAYTSVHYYLLFVM